MTSAAGEAQQGTAVRANGIDLWVYDEGPTDAEAVVLIAATAMPGFWWSRSLVDPLLAAGYRVVRYDHRDCGRSTWIDPDQPYAMSDLVDDLFGLLDGLAIGSAHLVGLAMGGTVAQHASADHADRVRSLTLLSTTPGAGDDRLPGPDADFIDAVVRRNLDGPPTEPDKQALWIVEMAELCASAGYPVDCDRQLALASHDVAHGWRPASGHGVAIFDAQSMLDRLGLIVTPTMVVHGGADRVVPPEHGRALATGIDGAVYLEVPGLGHFWPEPALGELAPVVKLHLDGAGRFDS